MAAVFAEEPVLNGSGVETEEIDPDLLVEAGIRKRRRANPNQARARVLPTSRLREASAWGAMLANMNALYLTNQLPPSARGSSPLNAQDGIGTAFFIIPTSKLSQMGIIT